MSAVPYRLNIELNVELFYPDRGFRLICVCRNLSDTGMYIHTREPAPEGTRLEYNLKMENEQRPFQGEALVRWVKPLPIIPGNRATFGMGIEFLALSPDAQVWIKEAIQSDQMARGIVPRQDLVLDGELNLAAEEQFAVDALYDAFSFQKVEEPEPEEETQTTPEEETQSTPEEETPALPEEETQATPEEETQTTPEEETQTTPEEETPATPEEETQALPEEETQTLPEEETQALPEEETQALPEEETDKPVESGTLTVDLRHSHTAYLSITQDGTTQDISLTPRVKQDSSGIHTNPQGTRLPLSLALSQSPEPLMRRLHSLGEFNELLTIGDDTLALTRALFEEIAVHLAHRPTDLRIEILCPMGHLEQAQAGLETVLTESRLKHVSFTPELEYYRAQRGTPEQILVLHLGSLESRLGWLDADGTSQAQTLELMGRVQIIDAIMPAIETLLREEHCIATHEDPMLLEFIREELQSLDGESELNVKSADVDLCLTQSELEQVTIMHTETLFDHIKPYISGLTDPSALEFLIIEEKTAWPGLVPRVIKELGLTPQCIKLESQQE